MMTDTNRDLVNLNRQSVRIIGQSGERTIVVRCDWLLPPVIDARFGVTDSMGAHYLTLGDYLRARGARIVENP